MTRKLQPFRRSDGVLELVVLGNFGLAYAYSGTDKVMHFVEDQDVGTDSVHSDTYYVQLDDNYTLAEYKPKGVHLIRNINTNTGTDKNATYETFSMHTDGKHNDDDDWVEQKCPSSDFQHLLNREKLIPMEMVEKE